MKQYKMWIGGKWVDAESGKTYAVYNPATEEEIAQVALGDRVDVDKAVAAARQAFPIWSKKPQAERSQVAMKIAALFREHSDVLGKTDVLDHGTPASAHQAARPGSGSGRGNLADDASRRLRQRQQSESEVGWHGSNPRQADLRATQPALVYRGGRFRQRR